MSRSRRLAAVVFLVALAPGCVMLAPRRRAPGPEARVLEGVPVRPFGTDRCGAGTLSAVLNYYGDPAGLDELDASLPKVDGGGVLSIDLVLAARARGFDARLVPGDVREVAGTILEGRPVILMLKVLDAPGVKRDLYHFVLADGFDPERRLFRLQLGEGKARWGRLEGLDRGWRAAGRAMILVAPASEANGAVLSPLAEGVRLEREGKLDEAAGAYRDLLSREPRSVRAWVNLGNVLARLRETEDAEGVYRRALDLEPGNRDALNNLAWLLYETGSRLDEAEPLARRAAAIPDPELPLSLDTLGRILLRRGRCADAVETFEHALGLLSGDDPQSCALLLEGLGQAQLSCGRLDEARGAFERALAELEASAETERAARAALEEMRRPR